MAVESQRIIGHSNFLFFVLLLSPNQMRDRLPLTDSDFKLLNKETEKLFIVVLCVNCSNLKRELFRMQMKMHKFENSVL